MIDKLIEKIKETDNPTVVGLDPRLEQIPEFIKTEAFEAYGKTPKAVAEAFFRFNKEIIDKIYDLIPAVKPQIAMYEQLGLDGIDCYIKTIEYAKSKDLIIIGDIKRGDIASTAKAYSDGHIGRVLVSENEFEIFKQDFITINPYMGYDSIEPYIDDCEKYDKGLFVLVKTSNPNSAEIQDLISDGKPIYEHVGQLVSKWGTNLIGANGFSKIGAVVGATHKEEARKLRELMPNTFFLVPGYGTQGGTAEDVKPCFNKGGLGAIVNSSRGITAAFLSEKYKHFSEKEFAEASRQAVADMKEDLNKTLKD